MCSCNTFYGPSCFVISGSQACDPTLFTMASFPEQSAATGDTPDVEMMSSHAQEDEVAGFRFYDSSRQHGTVEGVTVEVPAAEAALLSVTSDNAMELTSCSARHVGNRILSVPTQAIADALLRGDDFVTRSVLRVGWFHIFIRDHRGSQSAKSGRVFGRVLLKPPLLENSSRCYPVQDSQIFENPVVVLHGKTQLVWIADDVDMLAHLNAAINASAGLSARRSRSRSRSRSRVTSTGAHEISGIGGSHIVRRWGHRLVPRRERSDKNVKRLASDPLPVPPPPTMRLGPLDSDGVCMGPVLRPDKRSGGQRRRLAKAPATQLPRDDGDSTATRSVVQSNDVVVRLRVGRTLPRLEALMRWHLFQGTLPFDDRAPLSPTPGLFATIHTQPVFIIGTYSRYGVRMADVLRLKPHSGRREFMAYLSSVKTVPQAELQGVGPHFRLVNRKRVQVRRSLVFEPTSADDIRIAADAEYARRMAGGVNARDRKSVV